MEQQEAGSAKEGTALRRNHGREGRKGYGYLEFERTERFHFGGFDQPDE